jgi:hypothetical protein
MYIILKTIITARLIVGISEAGKCFTTFGAILTSLSLTSLLAFVWLYTDIKDMQIFSVPFWEILMMVIPSLAFIVTLPLLLKVTKSYLSLYISAALTAAAYFLWMLLVKKIGLTL